MALTGFFRTIRTICMYGINKFLYTRGDFLLRPKGFPHIRHVTIQLFSVYNIIYTYCEPNIESHDKIPLHVFKANGREISGRPRRADMDPLPQLLVIPGNILSPSVHLHSSRPSQKIPPAYLKSHPMFDPDRLHGGPS